MHPTDETLLTLLHGEMTDLPRGTVSKHVSECPSCFERLIELKKDEAEQAVMLSALDLPVPPVDVTMIRRRARRWRRAPTLAAAAAAVVVTVAAAMPNSPLRVWLRDRSTPAASTPEATPPAPTEQSAAFAIEVNPGLGFTVQIIRPQASGTIRITHGDQSFVTARAIGGVVSYRVQPAKLLLDNREPAERYEITLPRTLRGVRVEVGRRQVYPDGATDLAPADSVIVTLTRNFPNEGIQP